MTETTYQLSRSQNLPCIHYQRPCREAQEAARKVVSKICNRNRNSDLRADSREILEEHALLIHDLLVQREAYRSALELLLDWSDRIAVHRLGYTEEQVSEFFPKERSLLKTGIYE